MSLLSFFHTQMFSLCCAIVLIVISRESYNSWSGLPGLPTTSISAGFPKQQAGTNGSPAHFGSPTDIDGVGSPEP